MCESPVAFLSRIMSMTSFMLKRKPLINSSTFGANVDKSWLTSFVIALDAAAVRLSPSCKR